MTDTKKIVVFTTVSNREEAQNLARTLVGERLAACVNILPDVQSIYRWQGKVCDDTEIVLMIKTSSTAYGQLEKRLLELHSYDTPELIAFPIVLGAQKYLDWVESSLAK